MGLYVIAIGLMSLFDLYCTLQWIESNPYMEANPVMRCLWFVNPILFILFKIITTMLFCLIAFKLRDNKLRDNKLMRRLIWLPFCVYVLVIFVHCGG